MIGVPWMVAGLAGGVAIAAGLADRARRRRVDLDQVGVIDWPTAQIAALLVLIVALGLALR